MVPERGRGLPEPLRGPAHAVLRDLEGPTPLNGIYLTVEGSSALCLFEADGTGGGQTPEPQDSTDAALLVAIADVLQGELAERLVAWGEARPPCPWHAHPARPALIDGEAWWMCEARQEKLFRIGYGRSADDDR